MIAPPPEAQDLGPWRVDLMLAIWPRIGRALDTMRAIGAAQAGGDEVRHWLDLASGSGAQTFEHVDLARTLVVMASVENMHVDDWLRKTVAESQMPRRKTPAAADLQIRLREVSCRRLVASMVEDGYRVVIKNLRGDVASCTSPDFINALEGAVRMAGARKEDA